MDPGLRRGDGQWVAAVSFGGGTITVHDGQWAAVVSFGGGTIFVHDGQWAAVVSFGGGTISLHDGQWAAAASLGGGINMYVTPAKARVHGRRRSTGPLGNDRPHRHGASPAQSRGRRKSLYSRASGVPASGCQS
jgi:hypothetical protein